MLDRRFERVRYYWVFAANEVRRHSVIEATQAAAISGTSGPWDDIQS
jgi:hypothetical protein